MSRIERYESPEPSCGNTVAMDRALDKHVGGEHSGVMRVGTSSADAGGRQGGPKS